MDQCGVAGFRGELMYRFVFKEWEQGPREC